MKQHLFIMLIIVLLGVAAPHVFAQTAQQSGFVALAPIPGLTDQSTTSVINSTSLANFFNNLYKYLIGLAAVIAVIEIIWGGLEISTQDSVSKHTTGKERIYQAILGLVLVLSPVIVFSLINPNILNLSLSLPPLDTKMGTTASTTTAAPYTTANGTVVFDKGWSKTAVPGTWCFGAKPNSIPEGDFFCETTEAGCKLTYNGMCPVGQSGCAAVVSSCKKY